MSEHLHEHLEPGWITELSERRDRRIGLHVGETLREGERYFGRSVNLAARVAAQAAGEEIMVSADLVARIRDAGPVRFGPGRAVALKGISEPPEIHKAEWR